MHDGFKIAIGAGATALMAWLFHGPLGQGQAFLARQGRAAAAEPMPPVAIVTLAAGAPGVPKPATIRIPTGPVPAIQCQKAVDGAVGGRAVRFQPGSAWLNAASRAIIKDVARTLRQCRSYAVEVAGHSDNVGDEDIGRLMSEERARRVRDELIARGVSGSAVSARGYGSSRPIRPGQATDPANRRITFDVSAGGA